LSQQRLHLAGPGNALGGAARRGEGCRQESGDASGIETLAWKDLARLDCQARSVWSEWSEDARIAKMKDGLTRPAQTT